MIFLSPNSLTSRRPISQVAMLSLVLTAILLMPATTSAQSMYADYRANHQGDIITIVLAERTSAQRESGWKNQSDSKMGGSASVSNGNGLDGTFGVDARFNKNASNRNESVQSDLLRGTMTAIVDSVDNYGNLRISGQRMLSVNGEVHSMKLTGVVRPTDVQTSNTIMSYQIAQANIEYERKGGMKRSIFKPGRVVRFGAFAVLVAGFLAAK